MIVVTGAPARLLPNNDALTRNVYTWRSESGAIAAFCTVCKRLTPVCVLKASNNLYEGSDSAEMVFSERPSGWEWAGGGAPGWKRTAFPAKSSTVTVVAPPVLIIL